jgi:hypothetical protein
MSNHFQLEYDGHVVEIEAQRQLSGKKDYSLIGCDRHNARTMLQRMSGRYPRMDKSLDLVGCGL